MATRKRKEPWSTSLPLPPWAGGPEHVPAPVPESVTVGHSTPGGPLECLRCERLKLGRDVEGLDHVPTCAWRGKGDPGVG